MVKGEHGGSVGKHATESKDAENVQPQEHSEPEEVDGAMGGEQPEIEVDGGHACRSDAEPEKSGFSEGATRSTPPIDDFSRMSLLDKEMSPSDDVKEVCSSLGQNTSSPKSLNPRKDSPVCYQESSKEACTSKQGSTEVPSTMSKAACSPKDNYHGCEKTRALASELENQKTSLNGSQNGNSPKSDYSIDPAHTTPSSFIPNRSTVESNSPSGPPSFSLHDGSCGDESLTERRNLDVPVSFDSVGWTQPLEVHQQHMAAVLTAFSNDDKLFLEDAFSFFDRDGDGLITQSEIRLAMLAHGCNPTDQELDEMINEFDVNDDSMVNRKEFDCMIGKASKLKIQAEVLDNPLRLMFDVVDINRDGQIDYSEFRTMVFILGKATQKPCVSENNDSLLVRLGKAVQKRCTTESKTTQGLQENQMLALFCGVDADRNEAIDYEEFCQAITGEKNPDKNSKVEIKEPTIQDIEHSDSNEITQEC